MIHFFRYLITKNSPICAAVTIIVHHLIYFTMFAQVPTYLHGPIMVEP